MSWFSKSFSSLCEFFVLRFAEFPFYVAVRFAEKDKRRKGVVSMGSDRNTDSENLHQIYQENQKLRQKQMITIRISSSALEKARSLGKGYTIVIRNILEDVLMDDEKLKKYL